jgi:hypothetical protein
MLAAMRRAWSRLPIVVADDEAGRRRGVTDRRERCWMLRPSQARTSLGCVPSPFMPHRVHVQAVTATSKVPALNVMLLAA